MPAARRPHPLVSVCIPAFNEEAMIAETLRSVRESFAAAGAGEYEIIVCDNNSTDRTSQVAAANGAQVVFEPHNQIARARNAAAARARGEWLIFLDADTQLNATLLAETLARLGSGRVCGGGAIVRLDQPDINRLGLFLTELWNGISATLRLAAGSYVFCLRAAWEEAGGFDERVYAAEEIYFSRQVKRWGRKRGLRFEVIVDAPITTSARKMAWYGPWQLLRHVLRMLRPGAIKRRDDCGLWYQRPPEAERR